MRSSLAILLLPAAPAFAQSGTRPPQPPVPLEVFGRLPAIGNVAIAPDGAHYAAVVASPQGRQIRVLDAANRLVMASKLGDAKVRELAWADPRTVLATQSATLRDESIGTREWSTLSSFTLGDADWRPWMQGIASTVGVIAGDPAARAADGKTAVFVPVYFYPGTRALYSLHRVDPATRAATRVETGSEFTRGFLLDPSGKAVARVDVERTADQFELMVRRGGEWTAAYAEKAPIDQPAVLGLSADGAAVLLRRVRDDAYEDIAVPLAGGAPTPAATGDDADLILDPRTTRMIGYAREGMEQVAYTWLDPADQRVWAGIARAFPGHTVRLASWTPDRSKVVVRVDGPQTVSGYFLVDRAARSASALGATYPDLPPERAAERAAITYRAADGLEIPAYLTLPAGREAKALPLIVLPHGGPAARDDPGFDWWSQALASRGYAVLQPQFRGSEGFGAKFRNAGFGEWGRKMRTDLSDGVRHLAREGTIDPKRVCIAGASYGGYAAMAGITLDPGVYRCASAVAGLSSLPQWLRGSSPRSGFTRWWKRFFGTDAPEAPSLSELSPSRRVTADTPPLQLIHGTDDTVVPIVQSLTMQTAMRAAKRPVELVQLEGEDHWLSRERTRTAMLKAQVQFLERWNPPYP